MIESCTTLQMLQGFNSILNDGADVPNKDQNKQYQALLFLKD